MKKIKDLYKKYEEVIMYVIIGGITTLIGVGSKLLLLFTVFDAENSFELQLAIIISWILAVAFAYVANRIFVFKSKNDHILKEIVSFVSSRVITLLLDMGLLWLFITLIKMNSDFQVKVITIVIQVLVFVLNYVFSKLFVFKKKYEK